MKIKVENFEKFDTDISEKIDCYGACKTMVHIVQLHQQTISSQGKMVKIGKKILKAKRLPQWYWQY